MIMRVIYKETIDCKDCLYNKCNACFNLGKYLQDISFERDCPLPKREDIEKFTRYITIDKSIEACRNCRHWERWGYNKHLKTEVGICSCDGLACLSVKACNTKACEEFEEV